MSTMLNIRGILLVPNCSPNVCLDSAQPHKPVSIEHIYVNFWGRNTSLSVLGGYSSFSEDGPLSRIGLSQFNALLSNTTHPLSNATFDHAHPWRHRHRRRIPQARASRTSIYETVEEEMNMLPSSVSSSERPVIDP